MRIIIIVAIGILACDWAIAADFDPRWEQCERDAECDLIKWDCGWRSVNYAYYQEAKDYYDSVPCFGGNENGWAETELFAVCADNKCQLLKKEDEEDNAPWGSSLDDAFPDAAPRTVFGEPVQRHGTK